MPALTRIHLEALLRDRKLDRTLTSAIPAAAGDPACIAATGIAALDAPLGGGLPRGHLSEVAGPGSSGRMTIAAGLMAAAAERGETMALVDAVDRFDPESAVAAGVDLTRLLWIRGTPLGRLGIAATRREDLRRAVDRALKAAALVLQAGGFGLVVLDLADVPAPTLRAIPFTTWMRLQRFIEGTPTALVLVTPEPLARSAAGVTVTTRSGGRTGRWAGTSSRARLFQGLDLELRMIRARASVDDTTIALTALAGGRSPDAERAAPRGGGRQRVGVGGPLTRRRACCAARRRSSARGGGGRSPDAERATPRGGGLQRVGVGPHAP